MIDLKTIALDKKKTMLIAIVSFLLLYIDFNFILKNQLESIKAIAPKIEKTKKDLDNFAKDLKNIQELKSKNIQPQKNAPAKLKKIIYEEDVAELLQVISNIANRDAIKIIQMSPIRELPAQKLDKLPVAEKLASMFISLDLLCDYHALGKFINDLESAFIFLAVQNMKIESVQPDLFRQHVNLVLLTYVRK